MRWLWTIFYFQSWFLFFLLYWNFSRDFNRLGLLLPLLSRWLLWNLNRFFSNLNWLLLLNLNRLFNNLIWLLHWNLIWYLDFLCLWYLCLLLTWYLLLYYRCLINSNDFFRRSLFINLYLLFFFLLLLLLLDIF